MKKFILFFALFFPLLAAAQGLGPSFFAENTVEINVRDTYGNQQRCHAVRAGGTRLITAAHCVYRACASADCTVYVDLMNAVKTVRAEVNHGINKKKVFIKPGFVFGGGPKNDIAVIYLNPDAYYYADRKENKFIAPLDIKDVYPAAFDYKTVPRAISFDKKNYKFNSVFTAASVPGGAVNTHWVNTDLYYKNIEETASVIGMPLDGGWSGGGVFDAQGRLIGVVSGNTGSNELILVVFNPSVRDFVRSHVPMVFTNIGDIKSAKVLKDDDEELAAAYRLPA